MPAFGSSSPPKIASSVRRRRFSDVGPRPSENRRRFLCYTTVVEVAEIQSRKLARNPVTPEVLDSAFDLIQHGTTPTAACRELNISYWSFKTQVKKSPELQAALQEARACLIDDVEDRLIERALNGVERPVVQKGKRVYEIDPFTGDLLTDKNGNYIPVVERVFPDSVALSILKANKRDVYGDKVQHDVNVSHGVLRVPELPSSVEEWENQLPVIDITHTVEEVGEDE